MSHYANKEAANLERKAPGIGQGKGGSNIVTSTTGGLTYSLLPKVGYTGPDISVGAGGGKAGSISPTTTAISTTGPPARRTSAPPWAANSASGPPG